MPAAGLAAVLWEFSIIFPCMSSKTPFMNQYLSVKREYPDAILLFRLGDFYEMFYDDAKVASEILGIALTSRDRSKKNPVPCAAFPTTA